MFIRVIVFDRNFEALWKQLYGITAFVKITAVFTAFRITKYTNIAINVVDYRSTHTQLLDVLQWVEGLGGDRENSFFRFIGGLHRRGTF